jgi:hypothetical protein
MSDRSELVLHSVRRVLAPLVRLLLRHGITYPRLAAELKTVFLQAAEAELKAQNMPRTASALTLLSGVHRRDVRTLLAPAEARSAALGAHTAGKTPPLSLATEVIARWRHLHGKRRGKDAGLVPPLPRADFDALVASISQDVRPRAVLDELKRLGAVDEEDGGQVKLAAASFAPTRNFEAMAEFFAANLGDHAAAAGENFASRANFLDQAVFTDGISERSAQQLQQLSLEAWKAARTQVMDEVQALYAHDSAELPAAARRHRMRFGVYFYSEPEDQP